MRESQFRIRVDRDKSNLEFDCKLEIEERKCMGRGKWVMSSHRNKKMPLYAWIRFNIGL